MLVAAGWLYRIARDILKNMHYQLSHRQRSGGAHD
jgi:hypothetical protein